MAEWIELTVRGCTYRIAARICDVIRPGIPMHTIEGQEKLLSSNEIRVEIDGVLGGAETSTYFTYTEDEAQEAWLEYVSSQNTPIGRHTFMAGWRAARGMPNG